MEVLRFVSSLCGSLEDLNMGSGTAGTAVFFLTLMVMINFAIKLPYC